MHQGLTTKKAILLQEQFGRNEIEDRPSQTTLSILIQQFTSTLVILLILAAVASLFFGDILDGFFILLIVLLNGILGFVQEYRAEKAIAALKKMTTSTIRVLRDGKETKIDSTQLVPGDILFLEEGDKIPADCTLIESLHLEINESSLTGESLPVEKNAGDIEKHDVYLGTIVAKGRAKAEVIATGMSTRFGKIAAGLAQIKDEETPLQKRLSLLGKQLGILALVASSIVFVVGLLSGQNLIEMILTSISLAVAAVPEGLPAVITITLAVGMQRMARKKTILRKLSSIEALGSTTIIATDKTGTLTKNEMRVAAIWTKNKKLLLTAGVYCNNASLVTKENHGSFDVLGDSTEGALLLSAVDHKLPIDTIKNQGTLVEEYAFDPTLKMMTVLWKNKMTITAYTKGAPESVLAVCSGLSDTEVRKIEKSFLAYAARGLRVIALAQKTLNNIPKSRQEAEKNLTFLGFVGIADPARPEVKDAIYLASAAGIRTIMITGDNALTAKAIGEQIGLLKSNEEVITGEQFNRLTDEEAITRLPVIRIFARTTPDQKLRIVRLLQRMGNVVAVTGDGVNDALALKQSDVGVSMGITGTDVAKEASDMIITDDNYATIVTAVEEGRTIFDNIKSAVKYLVGCNLGEIIAVVVGILLGWPLILTPLQLLYINLVTDGMPALALAIAPKSEGIMRRKPRVTKSIFDRVDLVWLTEVSVLTAITTLVAYWLGNQTAAFTTIILVQHFIYLDIWTRDKTALNLHIWKNRIFLVTFFIPLLLQGLLLYIPYASEIFKITPLTLQEIFVIVIISSALLLFSEIRKTVLRSRSLST